MRHKACAPSAAALAAASDAAAALAAAALAAAALAAAALAAASDADASEAVAATSAAATSTSAAANSAAATSDAVCARHWPPPPRPLTTSAAPLRSHAQKPAKSFWSSLLQGLASVTMLSAGSHSYLDASNFGGLKAEPRWA